jgi:hypothetical protein
LPVNRYSGIRQEASLVRGVQGYCGDNPANERGISHGTEYKLP